MDERQSAAVRESVLATLHEFYCPLSSTELASLLRARNGLEVPAGEIEQLVALDEEAFDAAEDDAGIWLCPGLEPPELYPDTDFVTRSDWPLPVRLVEYTTEPKRRLWLLRVLADQVLVRLGERGDPTVFDELFAQLFPALPGDVRSSRFGQATRVDLTEEDQVETVRELAEDEYAVFGNSGSRIEETAAAKLSRREKLFGAVD
ncbi:MULTISPECIES: hypothetical protein [Amycolatopsis]|uniref:Uncharacterized protein n=1 Tax=Amycolatopsis bullii TaxID=941987 RepID=A0ABQ3KI39_9PSEU|nr:hypothetical protein [Amycolatopsis bullii]GHG21114.1 hypothetical protein GCM10017567_44660 [Amycolatopsis bullii]